MKSPPVPPFRALTKSLLLVLLLSLPLAPRAEPDPEATADAPRG